MKVNTDGQYARLISDFRGGTPRMNNEAEKARMNRRNLLAKEATKSLEQIKEERERRSGLST